MVGVARIELATPAMSTQCSTTELHAHIFFGRGVNRLSGRSPSAMRREPQAYQFRPDAVPT